MTYLPTKAMSEFVDPMNLGDGGVAETSLRFQIASAAGVTTRVPLASSVPARKPTRASTPGREADVAGVGEVLGELDPPHAASATAATAEQVTRSIFIGQFPKSETGIFCIRSISVP